MHLGEKSFGSGMMKGKALLCLLLVLSLFAFAGVASAKTIYVPDNYAKIQWAVDNASVGDTIIVRDGKYYENLKVDKQLTIKSENGSDNCIVDGGGTGDVITLNADGITIEGFTVRNSGSYLWTDAGIKVVSNANKIACNSITNNWHGIVLDSSSNNTIYNNNASSNNGCGIVLVEHHSNNNTIYNNTVNSNNGGGIGLHSSSNNTIYNNTVSSNNWDGISLEWSSNNTIYNNNASSNNDEGIDLYYSSNNTIYNNNASSNNDHGIYLRYSSNNTIYNNTASNTCDGISLEWSSNNTIYNNTASNNQLGVSLSWDSSNNTIYNNTANSNKQDGINLYSSSNNTIYNNTASNNQHGLVLDHSNNNTIYNSNASSNKYGIYLYYSNNNIIYLNNFINNTDNIYSSYSTNIWNSTSKITYTYNNSQYTSYLGNNWSDYNGSDKNGDGIGDTPYAIGGDADNYPLMQPWENYLTPENQPPNTPSNPSPANHTTDVPIDADLSWTGGDPDPGDRVTYDVYFGTSATPPLVSDDQPSTTYDLGILNYSTEYHWKIIATDNHGTSTEGPLWDFCTEAAPGAWSEDTRLTEDDDIDSLRPAVAISGNSVYVVWSDHRDGNDEIYFKKSSDGGITWGPDVRLTNTSKASDCPDITVSPNGHIHVVWRESHGTGPQGQPHQIHYMRSEDGGNTWMDVKQLTAYPASYAYTYCIPAICSDSQRLYLVWHDNREGGWHNPYYKISTDDGATWSADARLSNERISSHLPSVASDGAGGVHVVFSSNNGATTNSRIYYKRSLDWGSTWDTDVRLCTGDGSSISPSVAVDGNNVHVIWMSDKTGCYELYYRKSSDRGTTWGPEVQLTEIDGNSSCTSGYNKAIAVTGEKVRVVWMDQRDGNWEIYYKESTDGGATWSDDVRLTDDPAISYCPDIAATTDEIHVVWQDERDGNYEIYYKRLTVAANKIFDTGAPSNPYPSIAGTHHGTITPNRTIAVNKLYTYPCLGTGGHTESIELEENGELIANGSWNGYQSDWHNITLHNVTGAPYVRLLKGHKYNYTIVTGSYPQIIHATSKSVTGGTITCTQFTDANGNTYDNWIPAIRLWAE